MNKKYFGIPLYLMLIPFGVFVLGIIFGSFFDLSISQAIADGKSPFGNAMETVGYMICYAIIPIGGTLFALGMIPRKEIWKKVLGAVIYLLSLGIMIYILGDALCPNEHDYGITMHPALAYTAATLLGLLASLVIYFLVDGKQQDLLLVLGLVILVTVLLEFLFINATKYLNCRPRYRFLVSDYNTEGEVFRSWWQFQPWKYHDDFHKSWPSGHTAFSNHLMLLSFLTPIYRWHNKKTPYIIFSVTFFFNLFVAFSRITCGAHYLSDVSFGGLFSWTITVLVILLTNNILHKKQILEDPNHGLETH